MNDMEIILFFNYNLDYLLNLCIDDLDLHWNHILNLYECGISFRSVQNQYFNLE